MADNSGIQIKNLNSFNRALEKAPKELAKELKDAMAISLAQIHREVVPRTPVDTGALRRAYREQITGLKGVLSNAMEYAVKQHEGVFQHPRGGERKYLENAVKAKRSKVEKNFEKAIELTWKYVKRKTE